MLLEACKATVDESLAARVVGVDPGLTNEPTIVIRERHSYRAYPVYTTNRCRVALVNAH